MSGVTDPHQGEAATLSGTSVRRHDGDAYVTGRVRYTGDLYLPGAAHVVLVRSDLPHARIVVDSTAAASRPGVLAVVTGRSLA